MERWERRERKKNAKRNRIPKHGLGYVRLIGEVIKEKGRKNGRLVRTQVAED